ncbi:MAG: hypothetical protein ABSA74_00825 [Candidatus Staskawiczbacteria bacterium]|jgi:hypothetical protein
MKWEYLLFGSPTSLSLEQLNGYGDDEWELVCHDTLSGEPKFHGYIFKRPKREIPEPPRKHEPESND